MILIKKPFNIDIFNHLSLSLKLIAGDWFILNSDLSAIPMNRLNQLYTITVTDTTLINDLPYLEYDVWDGQVRRMTTGSDPLSDPLTGDSLNQHLNAAKFISKINAAYHYDRLFNSLISKESALEMSSWIEQISESNQIISNPNAATPLLSVLAPTRNMTVLEYAQKVLAANDSYQNERNSLLINLKNEYQKIDNCTDAATLKTLGWI